MATTKQNVCDYDEMPPVDANVHTGGFRWWRAIARVSGAVVLCCAIIMDAIGGRFDR